MRSAGPALLPFPQRSAVPVWRAKSSHTHYILHHSDTVIFIVAQAAADESLRCQILEQVIKSELVMCLSLKSPAGNWHGTENMNSWADAIIIYTSTNSAAEAALWHPCLSHSSLSITTPLWSKVKVWLFPLITVTNMQVDYSSWLLLAAWWITGCSPAFMNRGGNSVMRWRRAISALINSVCLLPADSLS